MIRIRDITLPPRHNVSQLSFEAAQLLRVSNSTIREVKIVRKSIDARKKPDVKINYTIDVKVSGNEEKILRNSRCKKAGIAPWTSYKVKPIKNLSGKRPVVVGFGPAGMFAALVLAMSGARPIVLERGEDAESRHEKVQKFWQTGELDMRSNVQFGEGGAGTFSDGKLNTGVNNPRIPWVLEQFVQAGAQENIRYDAKPHVGTDVLLHVVQSLRNKIISLGGEVRFNTQVTGLKTEDGKLVGLELEDGSSIECDHCILAIGHSARDTFRMLQASGIPMEPKAFSMGVRIEHRQDMVDLSQYGQLSPDLPPADYKLVSHQEDCTVYTFCMCPGGYVVAAASEEGGVVTNGMSFSDRGGENANAAVLVTVQPKDFPYPGPLGGAVWQREIEEKAYQISGSYRAPAQRFGDFLEGKASTGPGEIRPTYLPGVHWCDLHDVLPEKITTALKAGITELDGKLKGFASPDAVLTGPETRSSSPVRIVRDSDGQSPLVGLYPAGEGAGYAGGIMSAAVDGMEAAEAVLKAMQ
ncbi:MAG: FAD-dependent oxidoreductase [Oscillospiraceae bacterium]|nr:FAD-dependent oxidoreductase [Oscillospiraceae bacterium]